MQADDTKKEKKYASTNEESKTDIMREWFNFSICLPSFPCKIIVCNKSIKTTTSAFEYRFDVIDSTEYKSLLGANNMDMRYTYWQPLTLPKDEKG